MSKLNERQSPKLKVEEQRQGRPVKIPEAPPRKPNAADMAYQNRVAKKHERELDETHRLMKKTRLSR
jgi:hypothetical protein